MNPNQTIPAAPTQAAPTLHRAGSSPAGWGSDATDPVYAGQCRRCRGDLDEIGEAPCGGLCFSCAAE